MALSLLLTASVIAIVPQLNVPARAAENPVTPGNFTGHGFDQCEAPGQAAMDAWWTHSPFAAIGIYISGKSRYCKEQRNLTPEWVRTQLTTGWKLLPIHLGVQAACTTRTRYLDEGVINSDPTNTFEKARKRGRREAKIATDAAQKLGLAKGSTIFYDLEAWDTSRSWKCNRSAMFMLSSFTKKLHQLGYTSGVYSSAASGIRLLEEERRKNDGKIALPDTIWIADWDGEANVKTSYISNEGWQPSGRLKQYRGGHNERWGKVTINIDSNYLQLGAAKPKRKPGCTYDRVVRNEYPEITPTKKTWWIKPLKCGLKLRGFFDSGMKRRWGPKLDKAVKAYQASIGHQKQSKFTQGNWWKLRKQLKLV